MHATSLTSTHARVSPDRSRTRAGRATLAALTPLAIAAALVACADPPTSPSTSPSSISSGLSAADVLVDPPGYRVTDLGTLGGSFSIANGINNAGHVGGAANNAAQVEHFFLRRNGDMFDAGSLGGNASASGPNESDELAGLSETSDLDPDGEDFCGFGTHRTCLAAVWRSGVLAALRTRGGRNAQGLNLNDRGQVVGLAETTVQDPSCATGTPSQRYRYAPVVWGPRAGEAHPLPLPAGDEVGFAYGINDRDQVIGVTGSCATTSANGRIAGPHPVLWDRGQPIPLDPGSGAGTINTAAAINEAGQVVGASGTTAIHSYLWTRTSGMQDLGTIGGDLGSQAVWINDYAQVVGFSCINDPLCNVANPQTQTRAYLRVRGTMTDLNSLVVDGSNLYLLAGCAINNKGQIVGLALDTNTSELHAYLATPVFGHPGNGAFGTNGARRPVILSASARELLGRALHLTR